MVGLISEEEEEEAKKKKKKKKKKFCIIFFLLKRNPPFCLFVCLFVCFVLAHFFFCSFFWDTLVSKQKKRQIIFESHFFSISQKYEKTI